jgi:ATP-dependent 26S proteasome regulatory subunit
MTSNNHNLLDKTLIKPGMFDLTIEIPYCDPYTIIELIETFYDIILIEEFIDVLLECTNLKMTFSEVVAVLLENFDSHINAVSKFMLLNLDGPQIVL